MVNNDVIRVYVGTDRSQLLAVPVLEYSIKRHTKAKVEVIPMLDLPVPEPKDPRNSQRTGFSFSRFCIPKLAGYNGRAIYMDADMLVFKDIEELWNIPFDGAKIIVQKEVKFQDETLNKYGAPKTRKKQCAVMLLDCSRLNWEVEKIISRMDQGEFDYDQLMSELCILDEDEVKYGVPFEWNSLEHYDDTTCLVHYTDMTTQPWACTGNKNAFLWYSEIRRMIKDNKLTWSKIEEEIRLGYFRPSLIRDIKYRHFFPTWMHKYWDKQNSTLDKLSGYVAHKDVYEKKRIRNKAVKEFERKNNSESKNTENKKKNKTPLKLLFVANANIPTLQLSFIKPLKKDIDDGVVNIYYLTEAELKSVFGRELRKKKSLEYSIEKINEIKPSIVIFCRYSGPHTEELISHIRSINSISILHIDDDLLNVPVEIGEKKFEYHNHPLRLAAIDSLLNKCSLIYCSNQRLENRFKKLGYKNNYYSGRIYSSGETLNKPMASDNTNLKIGYMGFDHAHDFKIAVGAIEKILEKYPLASFELFGSIPLPKSLERFGSQVKCIEPVGEYEAFMNFFATLNWDIGICPLAATPFNEVKSNTKWVEYTSVGAAVVATKGTIYNECCSNECGLLVGDNEWYSAIEKLINNSKLRLKMVENAQSRLKTEYSSEKLREQVFNVLKIAKEHSN